MLFDLPPSLLLLVLSTIPRTSAASYLTGTLGLNASVTLPPTGSGSEYANACATAYSSYSSAQDSWSSNHQWIENQTDYIGGTSWRDITYYRDASTLCDGHPRVPKSPAVPISSSTKTYGIGQPAESTSIEQQTYFSYYPAPSPMCSIDPVDCDPLWDQYSSSLSSFQAANATGTAASNGAQITAPPVTPPCMNQSEASSYSEATKSIYGCGLCTMYGEGVELVYYPVPSTVSRNMCESTPAASLTHYNDDAVIEAYAGTAYRSNVTAAGKQTVVLEGHTFTTGTAYISISSVYAVDRCSSTIGSMLNNVVLAMPSASVLSLRYSQDHFQYFASTDKQTGYPVQYGDFNTPVPWSAWNGQQICYGPDWGSQCDIIYDDNFRPQLAIPPGIRQLDPSWGDCQLWYGGLYDPPRALTPAESVAALTAPGYNVPESTKASPAAASAAITATALPDQEPGRNTAAQDAPNPSSPSYVGGSGDTITMLQPTTMPTGGVGGPSQPHGSNGWKHTFSANGMQYVASSKDGSLCIAGATLGFSQPAQTLSGGVVASYGSDGLAIQGSTTMAFAGQPTEASIAGVEHLSNDGIMVSTVDGGQAASVATVDGSQSTGPAASTDSAALATGARQSTGFPTAVGASSAAIEVFTEGSSTYTASQAGESGAIAVGTRTVTQGGPAATLDDGRTISAASDGLVMGWSSRFAVADTSGVIQAATSGGYVVLGSTIAPGSATTEQGTIFSALPSGFGVEVIANGATTTVSATSNSSRAGSSVTVSMITTRVGTTAASGDSALSRSANGQQITAQSSNTATVTGAGNRNVASLIAVSIVCMMLGFL